MGAKDKYSFDIADLLAPGKSISRDNDVKTMEEQEAERFGQDTRLRKVLAIWTMVIISSWLLAVLLILVFKDTLKSEVLITLLATTTINVLGLPKIILEGLFRGRKRFSKVSTGKPKN